MKTTVELNEQDITEAVGLLLLKRGLSARGAVQIVVDDSNVGDPRGGGRVVTVRIEAEMCVRQDSGGSNIGARDAK